MVGILRSGVVAIGGETTGWALDLDDGTTIEVDVSEVAAAAKARDGERVTVVGTIETRDYIERRGVETLVARSIEP